MLRGPRNGVKAPGGTGAFIVTFAPAYPRRIPVSARAPKRKQGRGG